MDSDLVFMWAFILIGALAFIGLVTALLAGSLALIIVDTFLVALNAYLAADSYNDYRNKQ